MQTTAERDGDEWVLNGQKQWITNAPYADFAQVFARTSSRDEAGRYGGITCFIVESDEWELGSLNNTPPRSVNRRSFDLMTFGCRRIASSVKSDRRFTRRWTSSLSDD